MQPMKAFQKNKLKTSYRNKYNKKQPTISYILHLHKQPQVNVAYVKPVDHFATNKF